MSDISLAKPVGWRFPKSLKLNCSTAFTAVLKTGEKQAGPYFAIFRKSNGLVQSRLGLIVGKKALRRAIERNRVKRVLRESFRLQQTQLSGLDLVVIVYPDIRKLSKSELRQCIDRRLAKLS